MPDTQLTPALPTRTTLRKIAGWIRHIITPNGHRPVPEQPLDAVTDRLAHTGLALVAAGVFISGALSIAIALSVVVTRLPVYPAALVATPLLLVALYTLPLLAIRAVVHVVRLTDHRFTP